MSELNPRNYLLIARRNLGMSQDDAGALIGKGRSTIDRLERGWGAAYGPGFGQLRELCRAYQARAIELELDPTDYSEYKLCPGEFDLMKEVKGG